MSRDAIAEGVARYIMASRPNLNPAEEKALKDAAESGDIDAMCEFANCSYRKVPTDSTLAILWHAKAVLVSRDAAVESRAILSGSILPHRVVVCESEGNSHLTKAQILEVIAGVSLAGNRLAESSSDMISKMTRISAAELNARDLVEIYQNLIGRNPDNSNSRSGHEIRAQIAGKIAEELGCDCRAVSTNRYEPYRFVFELRGRAAPPIDLITRIKNFGVEVGVDAAKEDGFVPCLIDLTPIRERRPGFTVESPSARVMKMEKMVAEALVSGKMGGGGGRY